MTRRTGFAFLDVILASLLIGLAIVPLLALVSRVTRSAGMTRLRVLAHVLADNSLERFSIEPASVLRQRLAPPGLGETALGQDPLLALAPGSMTDLASSASLARAVELRPVPGRARAGVLVATVTWQEDGARRTHVARMLLFDEAPAEVANSGAGLP